MSRFFLLIILNQVGFYYRPTMADLTKSVYCRDACEDYFRISEAKMRICADFELTSSKVCGSVVTCDIPRGEVLRSANISMELIDSIRCCYSMTYVEHGACDADIPAAEENHQESSRSTVEQKECNCVHGLRIFTVELIVLLLLVILVLVLMLLIIREAGKRLRRQQRVAQPTPILCPLRASEDGNRMDVNSLDKLLGSN